jgi:glycosyltransferase involved in cell wall biosynthesis
VSSSSASPEVSVFIQTYQHVEYIRDAVDNVLSQRVPFELELVIADDCSTDGTREILREYRDRYPERIRLLLPERNLGPTQLFRRSVAELRGRYVAWLDGDDFWSDDEKLTLQVEALREHPEWAACFHDATVRDVDAGRPDRPYVPVIERATVTLAELVRQNCVPSLSVMARGDLVRALPEWVWSGLWSDWLALISIAQHGEIGYLPGSMGVYRTHRDGLCAGLPRSAQLEEDIFFFDLLLEALGPEWRSPIRESIRERRCQLAVEEAGVPFVGAVAVIGPEGETPTYLNGRNVLQLSVGEEAEALARRDRHGGLAAQLERWRLQLAALEPGHAHFSGGERPLPSSEEPCLHLLVVGLTARWLEAESRLGRQLPEASEVVSDSEDCTLLRVDGPLGPPAPLGAAVEVAEVTLQLEAGGLSGAHLDLPVVGQVIDAHAVEIAGWAIGGESVAVAVELVYEGRPFRRIPTGRRRLDLERGFSRQPDVHFAGFHTMLSLVGTSGETTIEVRAVLKDGRRTPLASIQLVSDCGESLASSPAPLVSVLVPGAGSPRQLEEAIESVLAQTYAKLEPIVVDGDPAGKVRLVADGYPGVRRVGGDGGRAAETMNAGLRASRGELLVFLDVGDRLLPRALELGVAALERRPEAAFALGRHRLLAAEDPDGEADPSPPSPRSRPALAEPLAGAILRRSALEQDRLSAQESVCHEGLVAEVRRA